MPPLVCPSPVILDHSFPRDIDTLKDVVEALGSIQELLEREELIFLVTPIFQLFLTDFCWDKLPSYPLLLDVHRYLTSLLLQPNESVFVQNTDHLASQYAHPIPTGCESTAATEIWADEAGRLFGLHARRCESEGSFFIGIACHRGFAGKPIDSYPRSSSPSFPLVGIADYQKLHDAEVWLTDPEIANKSISFADARKNVPLLGGTVSVSAVGSHYTVHFPSGLRPWVLSYNSEPLPDRFLKQLMPLTHKNLDYIRHVLYHGEKPLKTNRLLLSRDSYDD
jgi:hypothetical protein